MTKEQMKKVVATQPGLKGGRIRQTGEVFEVPVGSTAKWYRDVSPEGRASAASDADKNNDGKLDKGEILKWFEENNLEVDASLGVAALRKLHAEEVEKLNAPAAADE